MIRTTRDSIRLFILVRPSTFSVRIELNITAPVPRPNIAIKTRLDTIVDKAMFVLHELIHNIGKDNQQRNG